MVILVKAKQVSV